MPRCSRLCTEPATTEQIRCSLVSSVTTSVSPFERSWNPQPESLVQFRAALPEEWYNIPQAVIQRLIATMRRRLTTVINASWTN